MIARLASRAALTGLALAALAGPARAQRATTPAAAQPASYLGLVSFNPIAIPFNIFSAELEGAVAQGFTVGGVVSYIDVGRNDPRFTSFEVKGRYYPGEIALSGFSMGLGLGVLNFSDVTYSPTTPNGVRASHTSPTISIAADYNWLLGTQRRFLVGGGIGAKRILNTGDNDALDVPRAYPTARFTIGLAF